MIGNDGLTDTERQGFAERFRQGMGKKHDDSVLFLSDPDGCCSYAYICPKTGEGECLEHGGFDVCCDNPRCPGSEKHRDKHRQHKAVQCWCGNSWDLRPR